MKAACFLGFISSVFLCNANDVFDIFLKYIPSNPIVVEAGGHDGSDTCKMAKLWPMGKIYVFECRQDVYEKLCENIKPFSNIESFQIALGDKTGFVDFFLSSPKNPRDENPFDAQGSLFPPSEIFAWSDAIEFKSTVTVPVITLDDWADLHNITHIDFLWLDMQGAECQMLQASPKILSTVNVIFTEFSTIPFYTGTIVFSEYRTWLDSKGFSCLYKEPGDHGNAIFVRKNLLL